MKDTYKREDDFGVYIQKLSKDIKYLAEENLIKQNITLEQVKILRFLSMNFGESYCNQKDIETNFGIKRSSVTSILQNMEKNDLIIRVSDENDARVKKVKLTPKGSILSGELKDYIRNLEKVIVKDMSQEEMDLFKNFLKRSIQNVKELMQDV
ncbi:MAG: marR2 [Anaerocolumna sp.]|jgi:DNA-binding MarR family transcriptional regulator|nr:marR2 [Anaerocolumna sp.]